MGRVAHEVAQGQQERGPVQRPIERQQERQPARARRAAAAWRATARLATFRPKHRDARWTVGFSRANHPPAGARPRVDISKPAFGYGNRVATAAGFGFNPGRKAGLAEQRATGGPGRT